VKIVSLIFFADALGGKNGHLGADPNLGFVQDPKMSGQVRCSPRRPPIIRSPRDGPVKLRRPASTCRSEAGALTFAALRDRNEILRTVVRNIHTRAIESSPAE
jgi:hypothetical protein